MTKALGTTRARRDSSGYSSADLMARARTHLNTERRAEAKLYLPRCGRLERQAHYAVRDILYHRLTFIMLNLPQTPRRPPTCAAKCKAAPHPPSQLPHSPHRHSHICRQRLMGVERRVTVLPCIEETCSWKVQDERCLPGDALTTCRCDSPPLGSSGGGGGVWWGGLCVGVRRSPV